MSLRFLFLIFFTLTLTPSLSHTLTDTHTHTSLTDTQTEGEGEKEYSPEPNESFGVKKMRISFCFFLKVILRFCKCFILSFVGFIERRRERWWRHLPLERENISTICRCGLWEQTCCWRHPISFDFVSLSLSFNLFFSLFLFPFFCSILIHCVCVCVCACVCMCIDREVVEWRVMCG